MTASSGTTLNNTATISFNKSAQNFTSTSTSTTLVTGGGGGTELADLVIDKTGPTAVPVSSPMIYTLVVNNLGAANATNVKVVDTLPAGLSDVLYTTTSLFSCTDDEPALPHPPATITVTCAGGLVNAGANGSITIHATSPPTASTITNTASVDPDNTIAKKNELNNTSSLVNTTVGAPPPQPLLSIIKTDVTNPLQPWTAGAGPDPVVPGATLTYKVLVTNNSAFRADDVRLVDGTQGLAAASMTINQVVTNGAVGTQGGRAVALRADGAVGDDLVDRHARGGEPLRAVHQPHVVGAEGRGVRHQDLVGQRRAGDHGSGPAPPSSLHRIVDVGLDDAERRLRRGRANRRVDERRGVVQLVVLGDRVVGIDRGGVGDRARGSGEVALIVMVPFAPAFTRPPSQVTVTAAGGCGSAGSSSVQTNRLVVE